MGATALVTGVGGQDGVLLARHLLERGYTVIGTRRKGVTSRLAPYLHGVTVVEHDLIDTDGFAELVGVYEPDEVYNLAGFSSVGRSWDEPGLVHQVNAVAVERMLDVLRKSARRPRFFQASSSEVFGTAPADPQREDTPHLPANPYAEAKSRAQAATAAARDDGLFACAGILYNHESPLRDVHFVTRKITRAAAEVAAGLRETLELGNLETARDWGAARDYVGAMHAALSHDEPGDYVIATGQTHTLREFVEEAFTAAGVPDGWSRVVQNPALTRQSDARARVGDPSRALRILGWQAEIPFKSLVRSMVDIDQRRISTGVEESASYLA